jgi:eukaryotic translation initiation factor 2C
VSDFNRPKIVSNTLCRFNVKLGGINHVLEQESMNWLSKAPTMIVGMDVTHPSMS